MERADFNAGIKLLERKNPKHPILPTLAKGFSPINAFYLTHALKNVNLVANEAPESEIKESDPTLRTLYHKHRGFISEQRKLSNKFHVCTGDKQRAYVSDMILRLQDRIKDILEKIEAYKKHGKLPDIQEEEKYPIPNTPLAMERKIKTIGQQISKKKALIRKLRTEKQSDKVEKRIFNANQKLNDLQIHRAHVRNALDIALLDQEGVK